MFKNHPKGLPVLFFTEMWERFGFYTMLAIFVLYLLQLVEWVGFLELEDDRNLESNYLYDMLILVKVDLAYILEVKTNYRISMPF